MTRHLDQRNNGIAGNLMKPASAKYSISLAIVSGIATAVTFPAMFGGVMFPDMGFLAWFSLVPLFVAIHGERPGKTFLLSFITGFVCYAVSLYWLYHALTEYGKLTPAVSVAVLFLMMVILAAYFAIAPAWASWVRPRLRWPVFVLLPLAWVAVELARNYFPAGGFPWNNVAYSQSGYPVIIQTADILGIYGIAFLIILVNQFFAELVISWRDGEKDRIGAKFVAALILFVVSVAYGYYRIETVKLRSPGAQNVQVALIQGNIPQEEKWDEASLKKNLDVYKHYMGWVFHSGIQLAVWPESAYPYLVPLNATRVKPPDFGLNPEEGAPWLLFGALSVDTSKKERPLYNSALLLDNSGAFRGRYHKNHLVPFGEYVPYRKALFFVRKLVSPIGDFIAGASYEPLALKGFKVGPLVCYEDVFPEISRRLVRNGANILVNITNDAWYGWSSAAYQHLAISTFRAVENRRYMLRAANTGITAVVDPAGRVVLESKMFVPSFIAGKVSIFDGQTIYGRIGDLFAYICAGVFALLTAVVAILKPPPPNLPPQGRGRLRNGNYCRRKNGKGN